MRSIIRLVLLCVAALTLLIVAAPAQAGLLSGQSGGTLTLGGKCKLIPPLKTAAPIGTGACAGVRPGAIVRSSVGSCTENYLFQGSDGRQYIGTAGHCIIEAPESGGDFPEQKWAPGTGPEATDSAGNRIGEWAYAVLRDSEEADFSLIRLDTDLQARGIPVSAQMCSFGGPTGLNSDNPAAIPPTTLNYYGDGILVGNVNVVDVPTLPARSALALGMPSPKHVYAQGLVVPGDSGSAINSADGRAVGIVVTTGVHSNSVGTDGIDAGTTGIIRLGPMVQRANGFTGTTFTLQTAPTL